MNNPQKRQKDKQDFRKKLLKHVELFNSAVSTGSASEYCVSTNYKCHYQFIERGVICSFSKTPVAVK